MTPIPDGSDRIVAVDIQSDSSNICLVCVYMPARGSAGGDMEFQDTLDELHELIEKYRPIHRIIIGGDFNASLHRSQTVIWDTLLGEFLKEHNLQLPSHYPVKTTYRHEGTGASSQIDYWFLNEDSDKRVIIPSLNPFNMSDHVEVVLYMPNSPKVIPEKTSANVETLSCVEQKIRWEKCDTGLYKEVLETKLFMLEEVYPECDLDADLIVVSLNTTLYSASVAATPKGRSQKKRRKKVLPLWNDVIANAVGQSKQAHKWWQLAGSTENEDNPFVIHLGSVR